MFFVEAENNVKDEMIDWWVGTVLLAFLPTLVSIFMYLCLKQNLVFEGLSDACEQILGNGELIMSAFLVTTPTFIDFVKHGAYSEHKKHFYSLLFSCFAILLTYSTIKLNPNNNVWFVYGVSAISILVSILVSKAGKKCIQS